MGDNINISKIVIVVNVTLNMNILRRGGFKMEEYERILLLSVVFIGVMIVMFLFFYLENRRWKIIRKGIYTIQLDAMDNAYCCKICDHYYLSDETAYKCFLRCKKKNRK